jgi:hypothetical protein
MAPFVISLPKKRYNQSMQCLFHIYDFDMMIAQQSEEMDLNHHTMRAGGIQ